MSISSGRILRDRKFFHRVDAQQEQKAMYDHKTDVVTCMRRQSYDTYLIPNPSNERTVVKYWKEKKSYLLVGEHLRMNTMRLVSILADNAILGSAWSPAVVKGFASKELYVQRALCIWLNSTSGILTIMAIGAFSLFYLKFSVGNMKTIAVPNLKNERVLGILSQGQQATQEQVLLPLPDMNVYPVRQRIDEIVSEATDMPPVYIESGRKLIVKEPSVTGGRRWYFC